MRRNRLCSGSVRSKPRESVRLALTVAFMAAALAVAPDSNAQSVASPDKAQSQGKTSSSVCCRARRSTCPAVTRASR